MIKTGVRASAIFFVTIFLFFVAISISESGLRLLLQGVGSISGGAIAIGRVEGRLLSEFSLENIHVVIPGMDVKIEKLAWNWAPMRLFAGQFHVERLDVAGIVIGLRDNPTKAAPAGGALLLPRHFLPLSVKLGWVRLASLRFEDSNGSELLIFDSIDVQMEADDTHLSIGNFSLQGPELGLAVHGSIDLERNWHLDVLGDWRVVNYGFHQLQGTLSASGPLASPHARFAVNSPADIRIEGDVIDLLENPQWTATLEARNVDLEALIKHCPKIDLATVNGKLSGNTDGYGGLVEAVGTWDSLVDMQLQTKISAGLMGIDFFDLRIDRGDSWVVAENAKINWRRLFDWEGLFHFHNFDPAAFFSWLPGKLNADLTSVGTVRDDLGVDIDFEVFHLEGQLHEQPISASGKLALTENDVRTKGFVVRSGEVEGSARIENGLLSWADTLSWSGEIYLQDFDPAGFHADFPGQINGVLAGKGSLGSAGMEGFLKISDISGTLRGNELAGNGEISLADESIQTSGIFLRVGDSELMVKGKAGEDFALDMSLSSPDIGAFFPDSSGAVQVQGRLRGSYQSPLLDLELNGKEVLLGENRLARFNAGMQWQYGEDDYLQGSFVVEKLFLADLAIDQAKADFTGSSKVQGLVGEIIGQFGRLQLKAKASRNEGWVGQIDNFHLVSSAYGNWNQEGSASFNIDKPGAALKDFCLAEGEGTICAGGSLQFGGDTGWQFTSNFSALSLNLLNRLQLVKTLPLDGLFAGEIAASGENRLLLAGKAEVRLPEINLALDLEDEELNAINLENTILHMTYADSLLQTKLATEMNKGSRMNLSADIRVDDLFATPVRSLPLAGSIVVHDFDLTILSALTAYGFDPTGKINSSFVLGGTLGRPELVGEGSIEGGGIALPYQGITLRDVRMEVVAAEDGAKVLCQATSGAGMIHAEGGVRYGESGLEGDLHVRGKDFLLVNLPEYAIRVNPDVQFLFARKRAMIKGNVQIPYALITPEEMKDSLQVSQDVILVNGREEVKNSGWPFSLDLDVLLGDNVRIDGYGVTGRMTGQLRVKTVQNEFPTAEGELDLNDGVFSIYGRTFDIERGRVLFTGGPIDNPGLDVRAQKKFSEEEAKDRAYTVGVDISGLVQDLNYQLFSDPYMDDTEILSQMIVGRSLAFSNKEDVGLLESAAASLGLKGGANLFQGIGDILQLDDMHVEGSSKKENVSLVVGKRITKDLYIGYDMNMFSQLGQFRVRYDLTHGFAVETRSSSQSTGADLLYSFEK